MNKQAVWALVVVGALLVGFTGGTFLSGQREALADVQARLEQVEKQVGVRGSAGGSAIQRVAVVSFNDLALRFQESNPASIQQLRQEAERIRPEIERLQKQMERGEISAQAATDKALQLQEELNQKILKAVAGPIQAVIAQFAWEKGYDLVMKREDVVLYYQGTALVDITEQVWERLKAASK
jgi:Skp family chaperone for outer membrane proteins